MDGAGPDYDEEAVGGVGVLDDRGGGVAGGEDGVFGGRGLRDFVLEEVRRREGVVAADWETGKREIVRSWVRER